MKYLKKITLSLLTFVFVFLMVGQTYKVEASEEVPSYWTLESDGYYYLENENNEYFLVNRANGYSEIFHNKILNAYEIINNINLNSSGNVRIIDFNNENNLIDIYNERINKNKYKKNLFKESKYSTIHFNKGIN